MATKKSNKIIVKDGDSYAEVGKPVISKDVYELMERSDSHKDFTDDELAEISYNNKDHTRWTTPQLFKDTGRIYTKDLPKKIIEYFDKTYNIIPNEFGYIDKSKVPMFEGFLASIGGVSKATHARWCANYHEYGEAVEISRGKLVENIAGGALNMCYSAAVATLILKNISDYTDKIQIEGIPVTREKEQLDFSKLSIKELESLATSKIGLIKKLKEQGYINDNTDE